MMKFTYANDYTVLGNIMDETEEFVVVEFEAAPGFIDTVTFEKELTVIEDVENKETIELKGKAYELTTVVDRRWENRTYVGVLVKATKYDYIVFQSKLSENTIEVKRLVTNERGVTSTYYWDINKETLKGSGGLNKKVMEVVEAFR